MNYDMMQNNKVCLMGKIANEPVFSHEILGEGFYDINVNIERLSGQIDVVPVTVSERIMEGYDMTVGANICAQGQLRSYNKIVGERSKLILKVFAREIGNGEIDQPNLITLDGFVCKKPVYRTTPFEREISDMLIAVNRAYNKSDYIPVIAWGRNARFAKTLNVGDKVSVTGRIQSRNYQKQVDDGTYEDRIAYEVSVSKLSKI